MTELQTLLQRIEEDSQWLGQPPGLRIRLLSVKAMYQAACDAKAAVRETCDAIVAQAALLGSAGDLAVQYLGFALRASSAVGDWTAVRRHLPVFRAAAGHGSAGMQVFLRTFEAHLSLQDGRFVEALGTLRELATKPDLLEATYLDMAVLTRLALLELAEGSPAAAWRALEPLIERLESMAWPGHALSAGLQVLTQLSLASWDGAASKEGLATLHRWVELARRSKAGAQEKPHSSEAQQDAGLSHRELEVLALLAEGQSNKLIARALDLSPHVARILDRLDLASRMQAAVWYRTHVGG